MATRVKNNWQQPQDELPRWAVMVYMAAGNTSDLDAVGVRDLREMENGVNDHARVIVQINRAWPDAPQRYQIRPTKSKDDQRQHWRVGESVQVGSDINGADMGDWRTLSRFLRWSVDKYPAQHYLLVLWGHAYGLGFGRDHNDPLTLADLRTALEDFEAHRKLRSGAGDVPLDILGTNACAMSYVEAAYELRNSAQLMVASQISVPFEGWPYDAILRKITASTAPEELCHIIVDSYTSRLNTPLTGERVEMTTLRLSKAEGLKPCLNELAEALAAELLRPDHDQLLRVRDAFLGAVSGDVRPLVDVRDLCTALRDLQSQRVTAAAEQLEAVLSSLIAIVDQVSPAEETGTSPAGSMGLTDRASVPPGPISDRGGVGIFAPFVTDDGDLKRLELDDRASEMRRRRVSATPAQSTGKETYFALQLFEDNQTWPWLVYTGLRLAIPEELIAFVESVGVMSQSDRIGIAQIIMSIESWFNKFDRVLKDAEREITAELNAAFAPRDGKTRYGRGDHNDGESETNNVFGPPSLRLVSPVDLRKRTSVLEEMKTVRTEAGAIPQAVATDPTYSGATATGTSQMAAAARPVAGVTRPFVGRTIGWLMKVESALEGVERATTRGLTNGRFGLGPAGSTGFALEHPKDGFGLEHPKDGFGLEHPKDGHGLEHPKDGHGVRLLDGSSSRRSPEMDSGLDKVAGLYGLVAEAMRQMEQAVSDLESVTAAALRVEGMGKGLDSSSRVAVISREIGRSFGILSEGASNARRTVRRVVAHPVYGLGPGPVPFGRDAREELAVKSGLGRRHLLLL